MNGDFLHYLQVKMGPVAGGMAFLPRAPIAGRCPLPKHLFDTFGIKSSFW